MKKKTSPKSQRNLSTIELSVLGLAWLRGPCTTYAIMKELSTSGSTYYKSRAGTAYSVSKRLQNFGLLAESGEGAIQITEAGIAAIQAWLAPPIPLPDIAHSADLIRLRFFFVGIVPLADRLAFIDSSIDGLTEFLTKCKSLLKENEDIGDYFGVLATMSTVLETNARITWLQIVRDLVENPMAPDAPWAEMALQKCQL
ncbi:hypothetical protein MCEMSE15_01383 [Fimbriimonadaceae bacterium]